MEKNTIEELAQKGRYKIRRNPLEAARLMEEAAALAVENNYLDLAEDLYLQAAEVYENMGFAHGVPTLDGPTGMAKCLEKAADLQLPFNPVRAWEKQFEVFENYCSSTVMIYAETADEVYDQLNDILKHHKQVEEVFRKTLDLSPTLKERKITKQKGAKIIEKLAKLYLKKASRIYLRGEDLGEDAHRWFLNLAEEIKEF